MALAAPTISYVDGLGNASNNLAANASAYVTPGNVLTISLQSSTGVVQADAVITAPGTPLDGYRLPRLYATPFSWQVLLPLSPAVFQVNIEVFDGNNPSYNVNTFSTIQKTAGMVHRARGVSAANNESLTAFVSVSGGTIRDGVTYVQGDVVLLAGQTSKSQNGLYYVGAVASGSAPLTRVPDFATGTVLAAAQTCEVSEGTLFAQTTWKITTAGAITVDTTNHDWYPRAVTQQITLAASTFTVSNVPVLSATKTNVVCSGSVGGTPIAGTVGYGPVGALTPGTVGTASIVLDALASGMAKNGTTDTSVFNCTIINW